MPQSSTISLTLIFDNGRSFKSFIKDSLIAFCVKFAISTPINLLLPAGTYISFFDPLSLTSSHQRMLSSARSPLRFGRVRAKVPRTFFRLAKHRGCGKPQIHYICACHAVLFQKAKEYTIKIPRSIETS